MRKVVSRTILVTAFLSSVQVHSFAQSPPRNSDGDSNDGLFFSLAVGGGGGCADPPSNYCVAAAALDGVAVPGGALHITADSNPATMNDSGVVANIATLNSNPVLALTDSNGTRAVVRGCGVAGSGVRGACGDPCPGGGTFAGLFAGSMFAPHVNAGADVLFLADVANGSTSRGLYLYRDATHDVVKVAAIGDPDPNGGVIVAIGPGSLNNSRQVVFLAQNSAIVDANILRWDNGTLVHQVSVGEPAPPYGLYNRFVEETTSFPDGTTIPTGPTPGINNRGDVSFHAVTFGYQHGLYVTQNGTTTVYIRDTDITPIGGTYLDLWAPLINDNGEIAFFADVAFSLTNSTSAWFVGRPGAFRNALAFNDGVAGGAAVGLSVSRNPLSGLDGCGNLLVRCTIQWPGLRKETLVLCPPTGAPRIVAQEGGFASGGQMLASISGWPELANQLSGVSGARISGGAAESGYFAFHAGLTADTNCDGVVNNFDIDPFVLALTSRALYGAAFPTCDPLSADANQDGVVNNFDVDPFITCLLNRGCN